MKPILPHAWCLTWLSVAMAGPALAAEGAFQLVTEDVVGRPVVRQPPTGRRLGLGTLRRPLSHRCNRRNPLGKPACLFHDNVM